MKTVHWTRPVKTKMLNALIKASVSVWLVLSPVMMLFAFHVCIIGLNPLFNSPLFIYSQESSVLKTLWKKEKLLSISIFFTCSYHFKDRSAVKSFIVFKKCWIYAFNIGESILFIREKSKQRFCPKSVLNSRV